MNHIDDPVVERIMNMMKQRGISQKEMAAMLGVSEASFSKWKNRGSKSYTRYLGQLSEILNVPVSYLVSGDLDGDRKGAERMYSDNTSEMIRLFDELGERDQKFFIEMIKQFKKTFDE